MNTQNSHDWLDYATALATVFGAIVVAVYTFVTYWQARLTKEALAETRKSNETTKASTELAALSLELSQRAWLAFTAIEFGGKTYGGPPHAKMTVTNVGHVPATGVLIWCCVVPDLPETFVPGQFTATNALAAGVAIDFTNLLWAENEEPMRHSIYVYCEIRYSDCFGKARKSAACWTLSGRDWLYVGKHCHMD